MYETGNDPVLSFLALSQVLLHRIPGVGSNPAVNPLPGAISAGCGNNRQKKPPAGYKIFHGRYYDRL